MPPPSSELPTFALTVDQARAIVAPLYEALNQPAKKDVAALLAKATQPDYKSYSTNEDWLNCEQLADVFKTIGTAVPDLRWTTKDIMVSGDQITVRGEASGTPKGEFFGAKPTGRSFKTMSIDVTKSLDLGEQRYAYRRFGAGSGLPLLFLQHFTGTLDLQSTRGIAAVGRATSLPVYSGRYAYTTAEFLLSSDQRTIAWRKDPRLVSSD
jgi:predicted ester cyclase